MTIFTNGLRMQTTAPDINDLDAGLGEALGASAAEAWNANPVTGALPRMMELGEALGQLDPMGLPRTAEPTPEAKEFAAMGLPQPTVATDTQTVPMAEAKQRVKQAGLDSMLHLGDAQDIAAPALDIMIQRAQERMERNSTIERGSKGFVPSALSVGTSFLVGAVDPLNVGLAFIPVIGELRYAKLMSSAGEGALARGAVRARVGAASGAVGIIPTIPIEYAARTQERQDYTMAEALQTVLFGAALGGVLHTGGGLVSDVWRSRKGNAVYPFGEGEAYGPKPGPLPGEVPPRPSAGIFDEAPPAAAGTEPGPGPTGARGVYDDVLTQLKSTGMTDDEAKANAAVVASRYATRAERLGQDPDSAFDLYKQEGIDVRRIEDGAGELGAEGDRQFSQSSFDWTPGGGSKSVTVGKTTIDYGIAKDGKSGEVILVKTPAAERGEGSAREAMQQFVAEADRRGTTLFLNSDPMDKGIKKSGLDDFYKSLGFVKNTGRNKDFTSRAEFVRQPKTRAFDQSATTPTFYSAVDRAISTSKQEKASPDQWLGTIKNTPGVKSEELEWLGLNDWLKEQKGPVTKQQVRDFVRANQIEVKEVQKGNESDKPFWRVVDRNGDVIADDIGSEYQADRLATEEHARVERVESGGGTKFSSYQLPGGENYRELLLTLPPRSEIDATARNAHVDRWHDFEMEMRQKYGTTGTDDTLAAMSPVEREKYTQFERDYEPSPPEQNFRSSHWDEPNVLAHIRFNDRTINGKKTLFIEEVQSDWHQRGKKQGYQSNKFELREPTGETYEIYPTRAAAEIDMRANPELTLREIPGTGVPDAPFKTTWPELSMKRMIRYAAEHGYDQIAWTPGEVQAARYDLSKQVDHIEYNPTHKDLTAYDKEGNIVTHQRGVEPAKLPDFIGKEAAEKIVNNPTHKKGEFHVLENADLKVGGEGMLGFYDDILPATVNKLVKKYGVKVKQERMEHGEAGAMWGVENNLGDIVETFPNRQAAESYIASDRSHGELYLTEPPNGEQSGSTSTVAHAVDLSSDLKKAATEQGFPLFQGAPEGAPRGRITLDNNKAVIELFDRANPSTFMHEAGHLWLDELVRDAASAKASQSLKDDLALTLQWLGVERPQDIQVAQHEQWARGFEQYLASGEAPSPQLKSAFEKFKDWLLTIYRSLTELGRPIPEDIRGVMDRLIASDRDIAMREMSPEMRVISDLPQEAQRDVMQASIASLTKGEPVRAGEMLTAAARVDPRIAESVRLMDPSARPAEAGAVDQNAPALRAIDESEWKSLAAERPDYNDPDILDASHAVEKMPEPASLVTDPGKRLKAAEKSAQEADDLFAASEPYLDPNLVLKINDDIAKLDQASADTQTILKRGAACLASAFVGAVR